jgi:glycosyltransferase involved in cell wall biosynthesis
MAEQFDADICTGFWTKTSFPKPAKRPIELISHRLQIRGLKTLRLWAAFARARDLASSYDLRIYSGVAAPVMAPRGGGGVDVFYCHTPPRFLYDQRASYFSKLAPYMRVPYRLAVSQFERSYLAAVRSMDAVIANSRNIQSRLQRFTGLASTVIYPPVETERFRWGPPQGYYLSCARLAPWKRVDLIVQAFLQLPDKQLVVLSGGEMEKRIRAMAQGAPNIRIMGWVDEAALVDFMRHAIATIYIPIDEDFGISPVESMAAGKPVIGVAEGGLLETVVPGETGLLLPANPTPADIVRAVRELPEERASAMRASCEARAADFSSAHFARELGQFVRALAR